VWFPPAAPCYPGYQVPFPPPMPKFWIYTQALIVIFVVAGIVIAAVRLS
jgi:hypothetical protein